MIVGLANPLFCRNLLFLRKKYCLSKKALGKLTNISPYIIDIMESEIWPTMGIPVPYASLVRIGVIFMVDCDDMLTKDLSVE